MLLCILLHELGHAVVMRAYGFYPSIVLYSFGGLAIPHSGRIGVRRPGPWGDMLISFAGPASGFLLAAVLAMGLHYLGGYPSRSNSTCDVVPAVFVPNRLFCAFLNFVLQISVMWGLLNLLPIYPLDGGQIAQQIFVLTNPQDAIRQSLILSVIVGGMMAAIAFLQWHDILSGRALPLADILELHDAAVLRWRLALSDLARSCRPRLAGNALDGASIRDASPLVESRGRRSLQGASSSMAKNFADVLLQ